MGLNIDLVLPATRHLAAASYTNTSPLSQLSTEHLPVCCHLLCSTQQLIGAKIVFLSTAACFLLS